jgi:hypothetical protein
MTLMMTIITNNKFFTDILFSPGLSTKNDHCRKPTVVTVHCIMQIIYIAWIHH